MKEQNIRNTKHTFKDNVCTKCGIVLEAATSWNMLTCSVASDESATEDMPPINYWPLSTDVIRSKLGIADSAIRSIAKLASVAFLFFGVVMLIATVSKQPSLSALVGFSLVIFFSSILGLFLWRTGKGYIEHVISTDIKSMPITIPVQIQVVIRKGEYFKKFKELSLAYAHNNLSKILLLGRQWNLIGDRCSVAPQVLVYEYIQGRRENELEAAAEGEGELQQLKQLSILLSGGVRSIVQDVIAELENYSVEDPTIFALQYIKPINELIQEYLKAEFTDIRTKKVVQSLELIVIFLKNHRLPAQDTFDVQHRLVRAIYA